MSFFQIFLIGAGIFVGMILCLYLCNGFKITSPHNRRKREREIRRQTVYVITRQINSENRENNTTPPAAVPPTIIQSAPPAYSTLNTSALQDMRAANSPLDVIPPPSYNEAVRADRRTES